MWQHSYPEIQDNPQLPTGAVQINGVPMARLRLSQLRNLARAYEIQIDMDAPKPRVLPALQAAADSGVFQGKPPRPLYLLKAGWTSDEKFPLQHEDIYEYDGTLREGPKPAGVLNSHAKNKTQMESYEKTNDEWIALRRRHKERFPDVKIHGMKKAEMLERLGETE